jgi:hypothetical protein
MKEYHALTKDKAIAIDKGNACTLAKGANWEGKARLAKQAKEKCMLW